MLPTHPTISLLTPTYNRRSFLPNLVECIAAQTYPLAKMEWILKDDGTDRVEDMIPAFQKRLKDVKIRYIGLPAGDRLRVGAKRNRLHDLATGDICVCMDDDDYYYPDRVHHAVFKLRSNPKIELVGASEMYCYFVDDKSIWKSGPYPFPNHGTFGTMAYLTSYAKKVRCSETSFHAEEIEFTKNYTTPLVQLDPRKVMLVMCHKDNTFDKHKLRVETNPMFVKTGSKLKDFVKGPLKEVYTRLST
jgi:glycosyltransferase involved in cell wall biosynthesis